MALMVTSGMLTRADLDALPDDELRHELIDGAFVMTPAPGVPHQRMLSGLHAVLRAASAGTDLQVLFAPLDVALDTNVVEPDIVVAPRSSFSDRGLSSAPLLAVEVRSASTAWLDEGRKRSLYEEHGVESYWLADPLEPSVTILELRDGRYEIVARAEGTQSIHVVRPFAVSLNPAELVKG